MSNLDHLVKQSVNLLKEIVDRFPNSYHVRLHACYNLVVPEHWAIHNRINEDFHLVIIKNGEGAYTVGDSSISFEKGKIIFVSCGMLHSAYQDKTNPPSIIPVRFGIYDNVTGKPVNLSCGPFSFELTPNKGLDFLQLFEKLHRYYLTGGAYGDTLCGTIMTEILIACYMKLSEGNVEVIWDTRVEKMKRLMDEAPQVRYTAAQFAELADLSEKYFRRIFKRQYGLTPTAYQIKVRMEYARFLLEEGGQSIKKIADLLGYPDLYSFSKQFKHLMGKPPSVYAVVVQSSS
jgi:AraC-like DNA-binding protein/mannose-6-phosphate isomerase-like protein (cupin superfamily)